MGVSHPFNGSLQQVLLRPTGRGRWLGGAGIEKALARRHPFQALSTGSAIRSMT